MTDVTKEWRQDYDKKLCSADEAVKNIESGQHIFIGMAGGRPEHVISALVKNYKQYKDVHIMHGVTLGKAEYTEPEYNGHFIYDGIFLSKATRDAVNEGRADYFPNYYYELPRMIEEGIFPLDVLLVQVTPPDEFGYCSCGVVGDVIRQAVATAKTVIVQVNDKVPWTYGDNLIHVSDMDHIVEYSEPLPVLKYSEITEKERKIGEYCASLIEDGSTIQLGIGAIPEAVCKSLSNKKDLGIHSEMFSDGVMELFKMGVITNKKKTFGIGKMTADFVMGTEEFYKFIDKNPAVEIGNVQEINDPFNIARCSKMVCINSSTEIDIMGQAVSGSAGIRQISGTGGQMDFVKGANLSLDRKGKNIIAMTSTREKNGKVSSRIVPVISEGSSVTLTRQDINYIVTEYGIAELRGTNLQTRARALIRIAHPDFRQPLYEEFKLRFGIDFEE